MATLQEYIPSYTAKTQIRVDFRYPESLCRHSKEEELALFRFVQEALTNVARHAKTSFATVRIAQSFRHLTATVKDQGIGFDPQLAWGGKGFGLFGLKEQLRAPGGKREVHSVPGKGTVVKAKIPLKSPSNKKVTPKEE